MDFPLTAKPIRIAVGEDSIHARLHFRFASRLVHA
jgi:hypothetical protein